jgi:hypothetical protein
MTVGVPLGRGRSLLYGTPRFELIPGEGRREALTRARAHFQEFLRTVERILRERPYLWFNFIPLNPAAKPGAERSCVP